MRTKLRLLLVVLAVLAAQATAFGQLTVTNIAQGCTAEHSLFLKSDGSLWAMGHNQEGQLGDGTFGNPASNYSTNRPEQIVASGVTAIATGFSHSLFLKSDGSLWAMGFNFHGELGDGTYSTNVPYGTNRPEQIIASGVTAIAAGEGHSLFLKSDGSLWAMGYNYFGQLGDGTYSTNAPYGIASPKRIISSGVTAIAAGQYHSLIVKADGSLWAMGNNYNGELGDGTFGNPGSNYSTNQPEQIVASGVTAIAAGGAHSLFLKSDGSLWAMGDNHDGQLGDGTTNNVNQPEEIVASGVTAIAAGYYYSLFLKSDGSLWAMGRNATGQLGDGTFTSTNRPEQIVASGVTSIAAGGGHSLFLKFDGSLWVMGDNNWGQLGDGFANASPSTIPEQIVPSPEPVLMCSFAPQSTQDHGKAPPKTNLQLRATCQLGGTFYLLAGTNIAQPLNQWTPVWTNVITSRYTNIFSATLTNAVNSDDQQFYILQSQ